MENLEKIMDYVSSFKGHKELAKPVILQYEDRVCKSVKAYARNVIDCDCICNDCLCTGDFCDD